VKSNFRLLSPESATDFQRHSGQAGDSWRDPESRKNLDARFRGHDAGENTGINREL